MSMKNVSFRFIIVNEVLSFCYACVLFFSCDFISGNFLLHFRCSRKEVEGVHKNLNTYAKYNRLKW